MLLRLACAAFAALLVVTFPSHGVAALVRINWDDVPDSAASPANLPSDYFNTVSPRGVVFSTPGTGFRVSADASGVPEFGDIDPSYPGTFRALSPERLFTPIGSNIFDVSFFLPGTSTPALTSSFGAIFTDVDLSTTTSIEFFDAAAMSLGTFFVTGLVGNETLSSLEVTFPMPVISRVRITAGNAALGTGVLDQNGNPTDLVVLDDIFFEEPVAAPGDPAVPAPPTLALLSLGGLSLLARYRRRRPS
jgi:hypothetical protein